MSFRDRLMAHAERMRGTSKKWKLIFYALCYGASVRSVMTRRWS